MKIVWIVGLLLLSSSVWAGEITVHVNGMVCGFCAQGVKKKFTDEEPIAAVTVSLEKKTVQLTTRPDQDITDERIRAVFKSAGFEVRQIERLP